MICISLICFCRFDVWLRRKMTSSTIVEIVVALLFGAVATIEAQKTNGTNNAGGLMRLVRMSAEADDGETDVTAGEDSQSARFALIERSATNMTLGVSFPNATLERDLFGIFSATSLTGSTWSECIVQRVWPGMNYYEFAAAVATNETRRFWTLETYRDTDGDGLTDIDERTRTLTSAEEFDLGPRAEIPSGWGAQAEPESAVMLLASGESAYQRVNTTDYDWTEGSWR